MKNKNLGLLIQIVLFICAIMFLIISMFEKSFIYLSEILIAFTLFVMAYNNKKIYKRKYFTVLYICFASYLILSVIIDVLL